MWDLNAFVGEWPFRRLPDTTPQALEARLRRAGVERAFVSPLETLLHADPQPANRVWGRLLADQPFFRFVAVVNPSLPNGDATPVVCQDEMKAIALRLLPNYHGYELKDERVDNLAHIAGERRLPVIVQLRMQDRRSMHPLAPVPDVDWRGVLALGRRHPDLPLIVAGAKWAEAHELCREAKELSHFYLEISHLEYADGLRRFVDAWGTERLLFGTHAPLFVPAAAQLKIETARLSHEERHALVQGNAKRLWGKG